MGFFFIGYWTGFEARKGTALVSDETLLYRDLALTPSPSPRRERGAG
ncbi:hypothetical protein GFS31_10710 [Leptolyngbya sp. BL0902]|nr:hypothetical protein GFS31_10710 [Leptolyngbya sp. BL0902]